MKSSESLMTIIALLIGLSLTLALIFFNFSLVFTLKLLREGSVPVGRYLFMLSITGVNIGVMIWLAKIFKLAQKPVKPKPVKPRIHPREKAKNLLIDFAQRMRRFSLQEAIEETGLDALEASYLLDELLAAEYLEVQEIRGEFIYQIVQKPLVPVS